MTYIRNLFSRDGRIVASVAYIKSSGCYDSKSCCFEFYGNFVKRNKKELEKLAENEVIRLVFINPITEKREWWYYAKNLCYMLNQNNKSEKKYKLLYDRKKSPNGCEKDDDFPDNIAIFHEEFKELTESEDDNSKKITPKCTKQDCILHFKCRLLNAEREEIIS